MPDNLEDVLPFHLARDLLCWLLDERSGFVTLRVKDVRVLDVEIVDDPFPDR